MDKIMKKVTLFLNKATYLVMLLIASLTMFTGCSDDDKTSSAENFPPSDEETHFNSAITGVQYKGSGLCSSVVARLSYTYKPLAASSGRQFNDGLA